MQGLFAVVVVVSAVAATLRTLACVCVSVCVCLCVCLGCGPAIDPLQLLSLSVCLFRCFRRPCCCCRCSLASLVLATRDSLTHARSLPRLTQQQQPRCRTPHSQAHASTHSCSAFSLPPLFSLLLPLLLAAAACVAGRQMDDAVAGGSRIERSPSTPRVHWPTCCRSQRRCCRRHRRTLRTGGPA